MGTTTLRRRLWKTPVRDLVRLRITGRLDIDRLLAESALPENAAVMVRKVVKRTRLWRLEKVDVAKELIAHFQDGLDVGTQEDELVGSFGDEKQTAKLVRRAKKRQRPYAWHVFAWARLSFAAFIGLYILSALYLLTGSPSINVDYVAKINNRAVSVPIDEAAWPMYREALLELDLKREQVWDTPIPYYSDQPAEQIEQYRREVEEYGEAYANLPDENKEQYLSNLKEYGSVYGPYAPPGIGYGENQYEPPFRATQWERLEKSLLPDDPGWSQTVRFLSEHAETLTLIRQGAAKPGFGLVIGFAEDFTDEDRAAMNLNWVPDEETATEKSFRDPDRSMIGVLLSHLSPMRDMARLLAADTARATSEGDGETAHSNIIAILGIAEHADEHPFLISGLVRIAIQQQAYRSIQDVLTTSPELWSDEQLHHLAHRLAAIDNRHEDWFNGERAMFYDILQRLYTDNGHGGGRITKQGIVDFQAYTHGGYTYESLPTPYSAAITAGLPVAAVLVAPREEIRRVYDSFIDRAIIESQQSLWEFNASESVDHALEELASSQIDKMRYMPISVLMPAISSVSRTIQADAGANEGVLIGISLMMYQRQHGDWPGSLDELTPRYLPRVPRDRLTGEPLRYHVTGDGPVVYSLGVDGDDDGGRPPVNHQTGHVDNWQASPKRFTGEDRTDAEYDGDWMLWPVPYED
jgi:hypothetical protein